MKIFLKNLLLFIRDIFSDDDIFPMESYKKYSDDKF
jgi:hypothetical protein